MKRKSPFIDKKIYGRELQTVEDVVNYVQANPKGTVPNVLISYQTEDRQYHVTVLFRVISTSDVGMITRLYERLKALMKDQVRVKLTKDDAPFKSHIFPDAVIKLVEFPNHEKWATIHEKLTGYSWKPHVTFKDGKVKALGELQLEMWFGYMRQELNMGNGKPIAELIPPVERELFADE